MHKSQGSQYLAMMIPVPTQHYALLKRNLLFTESLGANAWRCRSVRR